jgi:hypothetical protein
VCEILVGKREGKERDHSEGLDVGRRIILKWIVRKFGWRVWMEFIWQVIGTSGGFL